MFCTQCGAQFDPGQNFCKNCGARVGHAAEPLETSSPRAPISLPRESGGNKKLIIFAAGVAVVVFAAAGVYLGGDLLKPAANQAPPRPEESLAKAGETPPLPSFEDRKEPGTAADSSAASVKPTLSPTVGAPSFPPEILPEPAPRADLPPSPTQPQTQRAGQDTPAPGRGARSQPPIPASRGGAAAGVYETQRATTVYEEPSGSAKTVASIPQGTRVNVVNSSGDWLEVHSKRGNPPGFIRRDDAAFIEKSN